MNLSRVSPLNQKILVFIEHLNLTLSLCVCSEVLPIGVNPLPMLVFDVSDVQTSLTRLLSLGAEMDGAIQYSLEGNRVGLLLTVLFLLCFRFA
jgi:hypothetical protein